MTSLHDCSYGPCGVQLAVKGDDGNDDDNDDSDGGDEERDQPPLNEHQQLVEKAVPAGQVAAFVCGLLQHIIPVQLLGGKTNRSLLFRKVKILLHP